jgi:protein-S-isoprenylcysteine O-methyltransferase Ste14
MALLTDRNDRGVVLGRAYFAVQAMAGAMWWIAVFTLPTIREATLGSLDPALIAAFDIPLFVIASAIAATSWLPAIWVAAAWTSLVAGGMTLYATVTTEAGWGALIMLAAAAGNVAAALLVRTGRLPTERMLFGPFAFRLARPASAPRNAGRTALQIVVFWGLTLGMVPAAIAFVEQRWQLALALSEGWAIGVRIAGVFVFLAASALGLWSAASMSTRGDGTPLPSAMPRLLVVTGPYRFVRNPMAIAGISQGAAIGLMLNSWLVVAYALCGSLVWNWIIRPLEEADLEARFGSAFNEYRDRVTCWIPRRPRM